MKIHLIRHGEVDNPGDTVYGDIPGFHLSAKGRGQAEAAGEYLTGHALRLVVTSPLDRAVETSRLIGAATGARLVTDSRLTEWALAVRWRGATWASLPTVFPGELESYLDNPTDLPFCPESTAQLATRIAAAVDDWTARSDGDVAFVSHEDPIHSAYLHLIQTIPARFHENKPRHCSVLTLQRSRTTWQAAARWDPPQ